MRTKTDCTAGRRLRVAASMTAMAALALLAGCGSGPERGSALDPVDRATPTSTTVATDSLTTAASTTRPSTATARDAGASTTAAPERLTNASRLRLDGIGPVRVGMTLEQAAVASGADFRVVQDPFPGSDCAYVRPVGGPAGLAFMLGGRQIVRVDVQAPVLSGPVPQIATLSGIHVGSTEAEVTATYPGRITVQGHPYLQGGHYLVYTPADPASRDLGLIFETDGQRVTSFRSGFADQVSWTEGCA